MSSMEAPINPIDEYARRLVAGELPAGKYHRLACVRHMKDRTREATDGFPYRFDIASAERFFRFAGQLKHYKGEWAGRLVELSDFQQFRLGSIFGWRHMETGLRRFTTAYNELPRKTGKSFEAAIVGLYVTFYEGEPGAEGYCIATKRGQARRVFEDMQKLVRSSGLKSRIRVQVANLHREDTSCKFEPLGADADSTDGLNPHCIITDEFHAMKNRDLIDVMESATGARRNPLHYQITTAGDDPVSPCGDQHEYACKVLEGVFDDFAAQSFFACIAHADPEDDWQSEETWKKANPHYGISVKLDDMLKLAQKAKAMPSAAAEFKQKRLNLWVNATAPCLSMDGWRKGQSTWTAEDMKHESCYVGVDLASKLDLCALSFVFPPTVGRFSWRLLNYIWTPEETLKDRSHADRAPYDVWVEQGWLLTTSGSEIDHHVIRDILKLHRTDFDIEQIGFDPWHAHDVIRDLKVEDGFAETQVLEVKQTYQYLSSAELVFQAAVMSAHVDARRCPVTAWAASNVINVSDGKGNIQFSKKKSRGRIDPIKAATIAMSLALRAQSVKPPAFQMLVLGGAR